MTANTTRQPLLSAITLVVIGTFIATPAAIAQTSNSGFKYVSKCPTFDQDPFHECHNDEKKAKYKYPPTFPTPNDNIPFDPFHTNGGEGGSGGGGGGNGRG